MITIIAQWKSLVEVIGHWGLPLIIDFIAFNSFSHPLENLLSSLNRFNILLY